MHSFYVYGHHAYRSEIALFRAERVTASECEIVAAPRDTRELYRVECIAHPELITHDMTAALDAFRKELSKDQPAARMSSVTVIY